MEIITRIAEMRPQTWMRRVIRLNRINDEYIRGSLGVTGIADKMR